MKNALWLGIGVAAGIAGYFIVKSMAGPTAAPVTVSPESEAQVPGTQASIPGRRMGRRAWQETYAPSYKEFAVDQPSRMTPLSGIF